MHIQACIRVRTYQTHKHMKRREKGERESVRQGNTVGQRRGWWRLGKPGKTVNRQSLKLRGNELYQCLREGLEVGPCFASSRVSRAARLGSVVYLGHGVPPDWRSSHLEKHLLCLSVANLSPQGSVTMYQTVLTWEATLGFWNGPCPQPNMLKLENLGGTVGSDEMLVCQK